MISEPSPEKTRTGRPERLKNRLTLYVRSLSPPGCLLKQSSVIDRLEKLESAGVIDEYSVEIWGTQLVESEADRTEVGRRIREQLDQFRAWAQERASTELCFHRETVHSEIADETYTRTVFPTMILAEYVEDRLQFVSPCIEGEDAVRVTDRIETLERSERAPTI